MPTKEHIGDSEPTFDPVSKIKALRQNLTQRLQELEPAEVSETLLSETPPEAEIPDLSASSSLQLVQQISHARELLSQLEIDRASVKKNNKKKTPLSRAASAETSSAVFTKMDWEKWEHYLEHYLPSLDTLRTINTVLIWFGFFGFLLGILLLSRYMNHDSRFIPSILFAGLTVVAIGCTGRFFHTKAG